MEEKQLIKKVKDEKNDEAYEILLAKYKNMIHSLVNEHNLHYGDYKISEEDLFQEGCLGLFDACIKYKEREDCSFSTFAYTVIKRRISRMFKKMLMPYIKETYSFDKIEFQDRIMLLPNTRVDENPLAYHAMKEKKEALNRICKKRDILDQKIIEYRLKGYSYKEIAEALKIDCKKIDNRLYKLRKQNLENKE